jgi:hypothetical protein
MVIIGRNSVGLGQAMTDSQGRYRIVLMGDSTSISVQACGYSTEHYLTARRQIDVAKELAETVADFNIRRGVIVSGRVLESATDRPIVSAPRRHCHDPISGGPLLAGYVYYYPLATNAALRGTQFGLYFEGANHYLSAAIDGDGRFQIAVPPGPGVLLVKAEPGQPMFAELTPGLKEGEEFRLFPYATLATRARNDGAPEGDARSFPGFSGSIPLSTPDSIFNYHAYRVIDPPADATTLELTLNVPRAPSRVLRFVDPDGRAIRGVTVQGLVAPPRKMTVSIDGSEAEVLALEPGTPREVITTSNDGKYAARFFVGTDDPQPETIRLEPAGSITGRLVDASTGLPLAGYSATFNYPGEGATRSERFGRWGGQVKTDGNGRFLIRSVIAGDRAAISFQEPVRPFIQARDHKPDSLRGLVLRSGEVRDVGDIRIQPSADAK